MDERSIMKTKKELKQKWRKELEEAFLYRNGHANQERKTQYIEGLATIMKQMHPDMPTYFKVAEALEGKAPDLAALAHQKHYQDREASQKSRVKSLLYLSNQGYEIPVVLEDRLQ